MNYKKEEVERDVCEYCGDILGSITITENENLEDFTKNIAKTIIIRRTCVECRRSLGKEQLETLKISFCPENCNFLSPKETEQEDKTIHHFCSKYKKRVFHGISKKHFTFHPRLVAFDNTCELAE